MEGEVRLRCALLCVCLAFSCLAPLSAQVVPSLSADMLPQNWKAELANLKTLSTMLLAEVSSQNERLRTSDESLSRLKASLESSAMRIAELEASLTKSKSITEGLQTEIAGLRKSLETSRLAWIAYRTGAEAKIKAQSVELWIWRGVAVVSVGAAIVLGLTH